MINREIIQDILPWLGKEKIIILKGPRQVGKTTIMKYLKENLEKQGFKTYYFTADEELGNPIFESSSYFSKYILDQFIFEENKKIYVFIDEFQYIKEAGLFLKVLFDKFKLNIQFIVSGSSSLEITKNSEFLTGRKIEFLVKHIGFYEYINYKSKNTYKKIKIENIEELKMFDNIYKNDILSHLLDYINYGGYPEVCVSENVLVKKGILKEIVNSYIKKDIIHFLKIENVWAFNNLIKLLSDQVGNLVNKLELANTLNINYETVNRYLDILEGTYIFNYIKPYFTNTRKEISKMPKVFINDVGILNNILSNNFDSLLLLPGNLVENFIFNILSNNFDQENIFYYRTIGKAEIDFVLKIENNLLPIEVKYRNKISGIPVIMENFSNTYLGKVNKKILISKSTLSIFDNNFIIPYYLIPFIEL